MKKRIFCATLFGLLIYAILPEKIAVVNDDFGYLRSVVETIQHHRPWTDDWLEPWAASFSGLSALIFAGTGSFYTATYGLLGALAAVAFFAFATLLSENGYSDNRCVGLACLVLTCATILWKSLEFTSVAFYLPCFFAALWACKNRRWGVFFLAWSFGMAARQSAITWALFPAIEAIILFKAGPKSVFAGWLPPTAVAIAGSLLFYLLRTEMNLTHAQSMMSERVFANFQMGRFFEVGKTGTVVFALAIGIGAFVQRTWLVLNAGVKRPPIWLAGLVIAGAVWLLIVDERQWIGIEHFCYDDPRGWLYFKALILVSAAGWLAGHFRIRLRYGFYALASIGLLSLRAGLWDYYLVDAALLGFLSVTPSLSAEEKTVTTDSWLAGKVVFAALALFHATFIFELKFALDRGSAICTMTEKAIRKGQLLPDEISFAPFGLIGWYWYPYYIKHEGANSPGIDGFGIYLKHGAINVGQGYSQVLHFLPRFRHVPPADRTALIDSGTFRFAWAFRSQFFYLRALPDKVEPPAVAVHAEEFKPTPFPLNDDEWKALIRGIPFGSGGHTNVRQTRTVCACKTL